MIYDSIFFNIRVVQIAHLIGICMNYVSSILIKQLSRCSHLISNDTMIGFIVFNFIFLLFIYIISIIKLLI